MTLTTIKQFDKVNLKALRTQLDAALAPVADNNGITLSLGSISFSGDQFTVRLTAGVMSDKPAGQFPEAAKWRLGFVRNCWGWEGIEETDLDKQFKINGEMMTLVGARPRAAIPLVMAKPNGKFIAVDVARVLQAKKAA